MGGVISDMFAILIESSGCFVFIFGSPEVVIPKISIFAPFIIDSVNDLFITFILSPTQPVRSQYSTSMSTITTEAATTLLRESYPSLILHSILNTRSSHIRQHTVAEHIVSTVSTIDPLTVLKGVVEHLTIHFVVFTVHHEDLVKCYMVGVVVDRWVLA